MRKVQTCYSTDMLRCTDLRLYLFIGYVAHTRRVGVCLVRYVRHTENGNTQKPRLKKTLRCKDSILFRLGLIVFIRMLSLMNRSQFDSADVKIVNSCLFIL